DAQSGGRLVEKQDGRPGDERGRKVEAPAHPAGVCADEAVGGVGEVEGGQELARPLTRVTSAEVVEPTDHVEILEAGQVLVHGGVLPRQPDLLANPRGLPDDIEACDAGRALVWDQQGGQD